ncbi:DUF4230 domain-containing protein [Bizionia sediminis]|uniref:DUF4230 domain-containing protein n=1 Tax=Bizionia sediminis TaxID=1737064 RepID=A0ABW5KVN8_9FLAO
MKKILLGIIVTVLALFLFQTYSTQKKEEAQLVASSALIQEQIKQVGKLIVTEGHFSQVLNYNNSKQILGPYLTSNKKALIVVNADVFIAFDLAQLEYDINQETKTLSLLNIPKPEIKIHPDLEYYDIEADFLNPFEAKDYNHINSMVKDALLKKVKQSDLHKNAQNRLISELAKFYILTNSLGWTLEYKQQSINGLEALQNITIPPIF